MGGVDAGGVGEGVEAVGEGRLLDAVVLAMVGAPKPATDPPAPLPNPATAGTEPVSVCTLGPLLEVGEGLA